MKSKIDKYIIITLSAILIIFVGYFGWAQNYFDKARKETFVSARTRCGKNPVIGADGGDGVGKVYYAPTDTNNELLSEYNPGDLNISDYKNPRFFCSVDEAQASGYQRHKCCGVGIPEDWAR